MFEPASQYHKMCELRGRNKHRNRTLAAGVQPGMDDELWDIALWEAEYQQWLIDSGHE